MTKNSLITLLRRKLNWPVLRPMTKVDLPQLVKLEEQVFREDAWDRSRFEYYLNNPAGVILLVLAFDQEVVSYILIETSEMDETMAELSSIGTKEDYLRKGYAKRLWEETLEKLEAWNYAKVVLTVRATNKVARRWYTRLGFDEIERVPAYYNHPDEEGIVMMKVLIEERPSQD